MSAKLFKSTKFFITNNQPDQYHEKFLEYLKNRSSIVYVAYAFHIAPTTGRSHVHYAIKSNVSIAISKTFPFDIEKLRGSWNQALDYLQHEHINEFGETWTPELHEIGIKPAERGRPQTVKDAMQMTNEDIKELDLCTALQVLKIQKTNQDDGINIDDFHKDVKVFYIQGPSGSFKTTDAVKLAKDNNINKLYLGKHVNGFWTGVKHSSNINTCLFYDDFRDSDMKASEFINMIDYNKHWMNIKGDQVLNDFNLIIITSVQKITDIYKNMTDEPKKQWLRRVQVIDKYNDDNNNDEDFSLTI